MAKIKYVKFNQFLRGGAKTFIGGGGGGGQKPPPLAPPEINPAVCLLQPLACSMKVLVQAGTVQRMAGSVSNVTQASDCELLGCILHTRPSLLRLELYARVLGVGMLTSS